MKNIVEQAFRQYVSGVADLNEKGEVKVEDKWSDDVFITFPNNSLEYVVVREYWDNGQKHWESEWRNGQLHGKSLGWHDDRQKAWEAEYRNGELVYEKYLGWYDNGQKAWEREYQNGELVYEKDY